VEVGVNIQARNRCFGRFSLPAKFLKITNFCLLWPRPPIFCVANNDRCQETKLESLLNLKGGLKVNVSAISTGVKRPD